MSVRTLAKGLLITFPEPLEHAHATNIIKAVLSCTDLAKLELVMSTYKECPMCERLIDCDASRRTAKRVYCSNRCKAIAHSRRRKG